MGQTDTRPMLYAFRCERDQRNKEVSKQCSVRKYYRLTQSFQLQIIASVRSTQNNDVSFAAHCGNSHGNQQREVVIAE